MLRLSLAAVLALFVVVSCDVYAQDSGLKTRELVAALDKTKYKKKEKPNVSIETYIDIKNQAAVRDPVEYSGSYESEDSEWSLSLHVERGGVVTGSGFDAMNGEINRRRSFVLKDATINGALLAGTKFYENGERRRVEAVFLNHTVASGKNANEIASHDTKFGIGFIETGTGSDYDTRRVFLERRGR
ncbi:MAG TPA: hypothetical protein VHR41_10055 [Gemmatimonadales bacterium]|jgi:hypothetical protein|nr:hypothetical protein [Gemmatimonadales bacterium]